MIDNDNIDNLKVCKVVLIGESGVGKTCIASRFINDTYDDEVKPTEAAAYLNKTIKTEDDKYIKFDIWDTCGQEKFRSMGKIFYKGVSVAILVYDITSKKSFEEIDKFWKGQVREYAPKNTNKFLSFF